MPEVLGKTLKLNVSGAIPAVLLGAGFPVAGAARACRSSRAPAGLIAHLYEEIRPADRLRAVVPGHARDGVRRRACRPASAGVSART